MDIVAMCNQRTPQEGMVTLETVLLTFVMESVKSFMLVGRLSFSSHQRP